jgi:hypothetical protein
LGQAYAEELREMFDLDPQAKIRNLSRASEPAPAWSRLRAARAAARGLRLASTQWYARHFRGHYPYIADEAELCFRLIY